jgi:small subunit ribosomal protein S6
MVRSYEMTLVFDPSLSPEKREEIQKKLFKEFKISSTLDLGAMTLEYPIKKQSQGHFLRVNFEGQAEAMARLREALKIMEGLLRYLIIKL